MEKQEELLSYFKRKANAILFKYSISKSSSDYGYQYLRMSSYFGRFNENLISLENELNTEAKNVLSDFLKEDMDIPCVLNNLSAYSRSTMLQYILGNRP